MLDCPAKHSSTEVVLLEALSSEILRLKHQSASLAPETLPEAELLARLSLFFVTALTLVKDRMVQALFRCGRRSRARHSFLCVLPA